MEHPPSLYKRLLDNLTTAVLLVNPELRVTYINPSAEALFDASSVRVLQEPLLSIMNEDGKPIEGLEQALHSGAPFTKRRTRIVTYARQEITVDYTVTPMGEQALILEVQPLDRLLNISKEEDLLSTQQTSRQLIRGLAHEIKNPLGGLRGAAQLLARELPSEGLTEYTNIIIEEADRLRALVDQLLGPNNLPNKTRINIHEVLQRVLKLLAAETLGSLKIVRDYDPSVPELVADKEQLIQAILNITRNAMQAMRKQKDAELKVVTRVKRQFTISGKKYALVCNVDIIDNGPGIPPEIAENIFFPMVSGNAEGTGLGLTIAQSIISQHDGLIRCDSVPGKTVFSLYIPLENSE